MAAQDVDLIGCCCVVATLLSENYAYEIFKRLWLLADSGISGSTSPLGKMLNTGCEG